jgi:hypothetical protein
LFCASIRRLRREIGIDFPVICVSGTEDYLICKEYGITHIEGSNDLASEKWNIGTMAFKETDLEYLVVSGSDDVFSTQTLLDLITAMEGRYDLIGFDKIYIYCVEGNYKGQLRLCTTRSKMLGVGKTIHRRVLEKVNWRPWEYAQPRRSGMDAIMHRNISPHTPARVIVDGIIVDCKSHDNLNKFSMFVNNRHGVPVDKNIFLNIIGEEEKQILGSFVGSNLNEFFTRRYGRR